ncbi:cell wall metabolism sensor histidine kinase WalK [Candidatus Cyanaurora vandensis]|uniref:sensor histidine kinase n=1 Tax=Candidatus Cyanaurora vandensis TaxID=2714958 RepID=UPI00257A0DD5|nr:HAMP domain-containing sensor histidine kinase [Candidatus Cyanaurora vandensis]
MFYLLVGLVGLVLGAVGTYLWWQNRLQVLVVGERIEGFTTLGQLRVYLSRQGQDLQTLTQQLQDNQRLLAALPLGYLCVGPDNRVLYGNPTAWLLLHRKESTQPLLLEVARSWELDALVETTRRTGRTQAQDCSLYPTPGSQPAPLRATSVPLQTGAVALFLEDRQEALNLATQRDQWTVDVAHELKTPLTSIRLVLETLVTRVEPRHSQWLARLLKEVMRLAQLVEDLLCLNQFALDRTLALQTEPLDLILLLEDSWAVMEPIAQVKGVGLAYQGPDHLPLEADQAYLRRVFLNLLDNAIKFSPAEGVLELTVQQFPSYLEIEVRDQGPGFPVQDLERVFQRFYRADPARSRQTGGTGLGLALVREIVQAHGGQVLAANHPAGGAQLRVQLPVLGP